ncbi:MAG: hypothetical protein AB7O78_11425 [Thermoleophilia bacterium]
MGTGDDVRRDEVLARLADALADGSVAVGEVERLLGRRHRRDRPGAAAVLATLGAVVVLCGLAIAFATVFGDLPAALRVAGPFAFPAAAAAGCVWLARRGAARWQTDLLGLVAYVAFGGACVASAWGSGLVDTGREAAVYALVAAAPAAALVATLHRATGSALLLWTGAPAVGFAVVIALAELAGVLSAATLPWVILAAGAAAAAGGILLLRRGRADGRVAFLWATAFGVAAVLTSPDDLDRFRVWHAVLAAVVVAAFLAGAALDFVPLIWLAAAGGALWVVLIAVVVGSATGAALAVVLAGFGLLGLGLLVARLHRPGGRPRGGRPVRDGDPG